MFWVEKARVEGNPLRAMLAVRMGHALCSPQPTQADVYHFMRDVTPGDIVFHIVDGKGIIGLSCVDSCVENVAVGFQMWYRVGLRGFTKLSPIISREVIFVPENAVRFTQLLAAGLTNTFFSRAMTLRQGAYLTPMASAVFEIISDADRRASGRDLREFILARFVAA